MDLRTEKRFKVHSMIQGMEVGETMDLELCEELIKKYGSSSDIDLLIEDNGKNMTYQEVVDLLNENEQLKFENNELKCALALDAVDYIIADGKKIDIPPYYEFEQRYDHVMHRREYDGYD